LRFIGEGYRCRSDRDLIEVKAAWRFTDEHGVSKKVVADLMKVKGDLVDPRHAYKRDLKIGGRCPGHC
jgi:hypothetical protein